MSEDFLASLWAATDVPALAARLLPSGRAIRGDSEWAAACPYCGSDEKDPRFSVDLKDGKYKCFKCNEVGNALTLAKRLWGRDWKREWAAACPRASEVLGPQAPPAAPAGPGGAHGARKPRKTAAQAWEAGKAALVASPGALDPLRDAWSLKPEWLAASGVVPHEGTFGFPATDPATGEVVDLKRRRLPPLPEGATKSASWPGGKAGLFGFGSLAAKPTATVVITEGEKDWAVASNDLDAYAVIGIGMGAGCFNPSWAEALRGRDVILAYDPDEAGVAGAAKACGYLVGVASRVRVMRPLFEAGPANDKGKATWPSGLDVFDYLRGAGNAKLLAEHLEASPEPAATAFNPVTFVRGMIADLEASGDDFDWNEVATSAFAALGRGGARWIRIEGAIHCVFNGSVYTVSSREYGWQRLMFTLCGRTSEEKEGRIFAKVIALNADLAAATPEQTPAWCVRKGCAVYVAINDASSRMVRITPDSIDVLDNGSDGVVTFPYEGSRPIKLLADLDYVKALETFDKATSYFACSDGDRTFLRWYVLTLLLYPFSQTHPVLRFRGDSAAGKSTAAKAITTILYGEPTLSSATNAALYRLARRRALVAIDNLEERDLRSNVELQNFVLVSATGRAREKSARDTDSAVVREEVKSLFLSTGIEPVGTDKPEVVNRTVEVTFHEKYGTPGFYEAGYIEHLQRERDVIWNLMFRVTQDALRSIRDGNLQKSLKTMGNQKRRLGEFFALMSIAQTGGDAVNDMVKAMLSGFDTDEKDTHHDGDASVPIFRAIPATIDDLGVPTIKDAGWIRTDFLPIPDLYRVLSFVARKYSLELPWRSANAMATRLNGDAAENLKAHGVVVERRRTSTSRLLRVSVKERIDPSGQQELPW